MTAPAGSQTAYGFFGAAGAARRRQEIRPEAINRTWVIREHKVVFFQPTNLQRELEVCGAGAQYEYEKHRLGFAFLSP